MTSFACCLGFPHALSNFHGRRHPAISGPARWRCKQWRWIGSGQQAAQQEYAPLDCRSADRPLVRFSVDAIHGNVYTNRHAMLSPHADAAAPAAAGKAAVQNKLWCRRPACIVQPGRPHHKTPKLLLDSRKVDPPSGPKGDSPIFVASCHKNRDSPPVPAKSIRPRAVCRQTKLPNLPMQHSPQKYKSTYDVAAGRNSHRRIDFGQDATPKLHATHLRIVALVQGEGSRSGGSNKTRP